MRSVEEAKNEVKKRLRWTRKRKRRTLDGGGRATEELLVRWYLGIKKDAEVDTTIYDFSYCREGRAKGGGCLMMEEVNKAKMGVHSRKKAPQCAMATTASWRQDGRAVPAGSPFFAGHAGTSGTLHLHRQRCLPHPLLPS